MKILYLLSQRPDSTGSGIYTRALIKRANKAGHRCFLVAACSAGDAQDTSDIPAERIEMVYFDKAPLPFPIPGMSDVMPYRSSRFMDLDESQLDAYEKAFGQVIKTMISEIQPDIIHSNHLWIMSALTREISGSIPMVTSCHGSDLRQFRNCPHLRDRVAEGIRGINRISALSVKQKEDITELFGLEEKRIQIIPNGFDPELFYPAVKAATPPVRILYAGKLASAKGVPLLLESLSHPALADLPFLLELAGSGGTDEEQYCRKLAGSLPERVTFCGALTPSELAIKMREAHLFVLPSYYEGLPLVVIEALASGCRVAATDLPGTRELVKDISEDWGCLVELPRLETADKPYERDLPMIRERLALAVAGQVRDRIMAGHPQPDCFGGLSRTHSWDYVFGLLENLYRSLL